MGDTHLGQVQRGDDQRTHVEKIGGFHHKNSSWRCIDKGNSPCYNILVLITA
jgi:hypothetical protein